MRESVSVAGEERQPAHRGKDDDDGLHAHRPRSARPRRASPSCRLRMVQRQHVLTLEGVESCARTFCPARDLDPPHREPDVVLLVVEDLLGRAAPVVLGEAVREAIALIALVSRFCRGERSRSARAGGAAREGEERGSATGVGLVVADAEPQKAGEESAGQSRAQAEVQARAVRPPEERRVGGVERRGERGRVGLLELGGAARQERQQWQELQPRPHHGRCRGERSGPAAPPLPRALAASTTTTAASRQPRFPVLLFVARLSHSQKSLKAVYEGDKNL